MTIRRETWDEVVAFLRGFGAGLPHEITAEKAVAELVQWAEEQARYWSRLEEAEKGETS